MRLKTSICQILVLIFLVATANASIAAKVTYTINIEGYLGVDILYDVYYEVRVKKNGEERIFTRRTSFPNNGLQDRVVPNINDRNEIVVVEIFFDSVSTPNVRKYKYEFMPESTNQIKLDIYSHQDFRNVVSPESFYNLVLSHTSDQIGNALSNESQSRATFQIGSIVFIDSNIVRNGLCSTQLLQLPVHNTTFISDNTYSSYLENTVNFSSGFSAGLSLPGKFASISAALSGCDFASVSVKVHNFHQLSATINPDSIFNRLNYVNPERFFENLYERLIAYSPEQRNRVSLILVDGHHRFDSVSYNILQYTKVSAEMSAGARSGELIFNGNGYFIKSTRDSVGTFLGSTIVSYSYQDLTSLLFASMLKWARLREHIYANQMRTERLDFLHKRNQIIGKRIIEIYRTLCSNETPELKGVIVCTLEDTTSIYQTIKAISDDIPHFLMELSPNIGTSERIRITQIRQLLNSLLIAGDEFVRNEQYIWFDQRNNRGEVSSGFEELKNQLSQYKYVLGLLEMSRLEVIPRN